MITISIINQKGGVGKTTTAFALASGLTKKGKKVLSIDLDPQRNLSYAMEANTSEKHILSVLQASTTMEESIQKLPQGDILSSSPFLVAAESMFTQVGKEFLLQESLETVEQHYDFCILDAPPTLGIMTINALTAAQAVVIPAQADIFSFQGIEDLALNIQSVKKYFNSNLCILGILLTRYNGRSIVTREVSELMERNASKLQTTVFAQKIRECSALKESQVMQENIFDYASKSNASLDYMALTEEIQGLLETLLKTVEK